MLENDIGTTSRSEKKIFFLVKCGIYGKVGLTFKEFKKG